MNSKFVVNDMIIIRDVSIMFRFGLFLQKR